MQSSVNTLIALVAGFAAAVVLIVVVRAVARRVLLVKQLLFPLGVAAVAAGLKLFTVLAPAEYPVLNSTLTGILVFLLSVALVRVLGLVLFDVYLQARGVRLPPLLPKVAMGAIYVVAAVVIVRAIWPDAPMTALVTTSAVTSLVLGLALQPILGNFFAGLVISVEKPYRINDWISVDGVDGRVVEITWRTTRLRTRENDDLVIPNAEIANQQVLNYYYPNALHLIRIPVGVHYRTPPYRAKQALMDALENVPKVLKKPSPEVYLLSFDDSAITYEVRAWIEDVASEPRVSSHVRSEIWEMFRRRGITIPFPIRTLEIEPQARQLELVRPRREERQDGQPYPARLFVARGRDRGRILRLEGKTVKVGRSSSCDLTLEEQRASKEHFQIIWSDEEGYVLEDLQSRNGTKVNNRMTERQPLHSFDRIEVGDTVIAFESRRGN